MREYKKATKLRNKLNEFRPLTEWDIELIRKIERTEEIYTSNAIEGNTLTMYETRMILETGVTIVGKPLREHLEVVNLKEAIEFVEDLVNGNHNLDERTLKQIHYIVYNKLSPQRNVAGVYRDLNVEIYGSEHKPPKWEEIQDEMNTMFKWNEESQDTLHPIEYSALLHQKFVTIHPFRDGNGRTARLLMNFALTRSGYPPITINPDKENRSAYMKALELSNTTGDINPFIDIIESAVIKKLEELVKMLEHSKSKEKENEAFLKEMEEKFGK